MSGQIRIQSGASPRVADEVTVKHLVSELRQNGVVVLPPLFTDQQIADMRKAFEARLHGVRWNDLDGYEREPLRHVLQEVLTLEQGFLDLAVHPLVADTLRTYIGRDFALTEAKGWKSLPTKRDFQGWHGDYWFDEKKVEGIAKEVKVAMYLTDVQSGAFNYLKGSHQKQQPRVVQTREVEDLISSNVLEIKGKAGTAFMFDSSGIHKQAVPILEPRYAVFYNYHDPKVPLAREAIDYYRYHPLMLNAAFLGDLSAESQRILGFGNKIRYLPAFQRATEHRHFYKTIERMFGACIWVSDFHERAVDRINRILQRKN